MSPDRAPHTLRSPEVAALAASGGIAVLPIGAHEQHGAHLPLATDAIIAEALARRAVAQLPAEVSAWVLPTLGFGFSPEHIGFPGTVTLSPTTLLALLDDLGASLAASGVTTLAFVNAHGGNPELLLVASRELRRRHGVAASPIHAPGLPLPSELVTRIPEPDFDIHAGFIETSILLALDPALVDLDAAEPDGLDRARRLAARARLGFSGAAPVPWMTADLSSSGTIGDPRGADAGWGASALEAWSCALAETLVEIAASARDSGPGRAPAMSSDPRLEPGGPA